MNTRPRFVPFLVVTAIMVFSLLAAGCTSSSTTLPPGMLNGTQNAIIIKNFAFSPSALTIKAGRSVTWVNQDDVNHTVVSDPGTPVAFRSSNITFGGSYTFTFSKPGTYSYHCTIHPSMTGSVTVTP